MTRTGGAELARMIREDAVQRLPLMLITGKSRSQSARSARYEAGADDVVRKPFHFEVLIARIARRIERARAVKRLHDDNATLDARVVERAIAVGELRDRLHASEAERAGSNDGEAVGLGRQRLDTRGSCGADVVALQRHREIGDHESAALPQS